MNEPCVFLDRLLAGKNPKDHLAFFWAISNPVCFTTSLYTQVYFCYISALTTQQMIPSKGELLVGGVSVFWSKDLDFRHGQRHFWA